MIRSYYLHLLFVDILVFNIVCQLLQCNGEVWPIQLSIATIVYVHYNLFTVNTDLILPKNWVKSLHLSMWIMEPKITNCYLSPLKPILIYPHGYWSNGFLPSVLSPVLQLLRTENISMKHYVKLKCQFLGIIVLVLISMLRTLIACLLVLKKAMKEKNNIEIYPGFLFIELFKMAFLSLHTSDKWIDQLEKKENKLGILSKTKWLGWLEKL